MVDTNNWTLADLRARWRKHTGRSQTTDISDADVNESINDYYVNRFPGDAKVDEFDVFFTQALSATDNGIYPIAQNIDRLGNPLTINGNEIILSRDREEFFSSNHLHHGDHTLDHFGSHFGDHFGPYIDEQFITDPGLAIGTGDKAKVKHDAFDYDIQNFAYSKATSEVALTGDTVPQNKYGAWSLKIDTDGTITVAAADDNVTGYDTPRKALEALEKTDNESAYMGYVTVISTDAGGFIPATTTLDDGAVTDTFTDGRFEIRDTPTMALLYGQDLYVRPKANDIYQLQSLSIGDRPTAFTGDSDAPEDIKWGPMIALGAAILFLKGVHDDTRADELVSTMKYFKDGVNSDKWKRLKGRVREPQF